MQAELAVLQADANLAESRHDPNDPMGWLGDWFTLQQTMLDAARAAVKAQAKVMLRQIEARRKTLEWNWGREFRIQVDKDLRAQHGKKKSVDYEGGRAGYRIAGGKETLVVEDEDAAATFAAMNVPDALKTEVLKSVLLEHAQATGEEIPGCRRETPEKRDTFYAGKHVLDVSMPEPEPTPLLEGEHDDARTD